jgi:hypothetical protein
MECCHIVLLLIKPKWILEQCHSRVCGGHFSAKTIVEFFLHVGYYWPSLHQDSHLLVKKCEAFQCFIGKKKLYIFLLIPLKYKSLSSKMGYGLYWNTDSTIGITYQNVIL